MYGEVEMVRTPQNLVSDWTRQFWETMGRTRLDQIIMGWSNISFHRW